MMMITDVRAEYQALGCISTRDVSGYVARNEFLGTIRNVLFTYPRWVKLLWAHVSRAKVIVYIKPETDVCEEWVTSVVLVGMFVAVEATNSMLLRFAPTSPHPFI